MSNLLAAFGIRSQHNFDSRLLFITDKVAFLEWLRGTAPEYDFRITANLVRLDKWNSNITNDNCFKYKIVGSKIEEQLESDSTIIEMNKLCRSWIEHYTFFVGVINQQRRHVGVAENFNFQSVIYQEKFKEANDILQGNTSNLKFLIFEATYKNISLEELAHRVILENDMFMGYLSRTEFLRVKWLGTLQKSRSIEEHKVIRTQFLGELHEYHRLS